MPKIFNPNEYGCLMFPTNHRPLGGGTRLFWSRGKLLSEKHKAAKRQPPKLQMHK